nr:UvrD-like helicase, ATP-binding domain, P-loop containing nucleoside triphosphate hydrolase [Tanacetum cinerariifolium]
MSDHNFHNSYENQTQKILKSVFVTNFPEDSTARDLWKVCSDYGMVVDVFIPFKRSKSGKRFAFVRFIKPALVLDETCIKEFDFGMSLMGRAKDVSAIPNLPCIISKEGFKNVKLSYLGGMWVLFEFDSLALKKKFLNHSDDQDDLSSDEESQEGEVANKADNNESDVDRVSESSFMHENDTAHRDVNSCKKESDESKFPPGFTPDNNDQEKNMEENIKATTERVQSLSNKLNDRCSNRRFSLQRSMNSHSRKSKVGGSILDLIDELVTVGQTMGYNMA